MSKSHMIWWIVGVQIILITIGFFHHWMYPLDSLLYDMYDGFKNNFTLASYVTFPQHPNFGFGEYYGMNYPYGDMVVFTDNTPAVSMPLKWIHQNIVSLEQIVFPIFNWILISGILWSSILIYKILQGFVKSRYLLFMASIALPWINPQLIRFSNGHFNLALSCLLLWALYHTIRLLRSYSGDRSLRQGIYLSFVIFLSSLFHVYYLAICGLFVGLILVIYFLIKKGPWDIRPLLSSIWVPGLAGLFFVLFCLLLGQDVLSKSTNSPGFDISDWRLNPEGLITSYPHFGVDFFLESIKPVHPESNSYLGSFFLFGTLILVLFKRSFSFSFFPHEAIWKSVFWAGVICLIASLGVKIKIDSLGLVFENFINPFFWISKFTNILEHFRCLGRFNWPFFWCANFILIMAMDQVLMNAKLPNGLKWIVYVLPVFLLLDTKDAIRFHHHERYNNYFTQHKMSIIEELTADIDPKSYQAILSIPFYHIGSGEWQYTYDVEIISGRRSMQMANYLKLPLINSAMSRTVIDQARKQNLLFTDVNRSSLMDLPSDLPILVLSNNAILDQMESRAIKDDFQKMKDFIPIQRKWLESESLEVIKEVGDWKLFKWEEVKR